jgi:hypothetical protein
VLEDDHGLDLTGWTLRLAKAISPDGTMIIGWGVDPDGNEAAFRAAVPLPEPGLGTGLAAGAVLLGLLGRRRRA